MADDDTDTQTQTAPDYSGASPEVLRALLNQPAAGASGGGSPVDLGSLAQQLLQQPTLPQPDTTPAEGGFRGLLGRIGNAAAGGPLTDVMSPAQRERAGIRALGDFGTSLMAGSGYYPGKPMFGGLAEGFRGAEASERGSEQASAAYLAAQQQYAAGQQQQYLERVKAALPLLTLDQQSRQAAAARALAGGGAAPGTAAGAGQPGATYESTIGGMEGTGKNPRSSSSGVGGFLDSTWQDFASANPDLFKGMTPAQVMAAKSDPGLGAKAITWLAQRNAGVLGNSNIAPTGQSLGIAHYVGPGPAAKIMAAPDNAPVAGFVSPEAVKANPELQTMTAGQMKQRYAGVPTPGFLKPAGGPAASAAPLPAPVQTAGPGAPTGGAATAAPDTTPWDLPGATSAAPATPTPPTDTTTPTPPPAQPVAPAHPDIPVPGGGVISHPGEFADYRAKQFVPPTGEDFNPNLAPEQQQAFATKAQQLQLAQQQVSTLPFAEQPKALIEVKAKQAELAAAQQDAIAAKRQAAAANVTKYNEGQQKDIQTRYDAATAAYNTAAHTQITGQQQTALEQQKGQNAIQLEQAKGQTADESKVMQGLDETRESARAAIDQIGIARALSQSAGDPTFWQTVQKSHPAVVQTMANSGFLSPETVAQLGQAGALDAAANKLISMARTGSGFQRMTNLDVQILSSQAPQSVDPQQWREAKMAYLQSYMERQLHYVDAVRSLRADGMPLYQAQSKAAQDQGDVVQQIPNFTDTPQKSASQQRVDWAQTNLAPNTFFRAPDGKSLILWPGPTAAAPPQQRPAAPASLRPVTVPVN